jgi:hypothetical protein
VLRRVEGQVLVLHLNRGDKAGAAVDLLGDHEPAADDRAGFLHGAVAGQQSVGEGPFGVPDQRLGQRGPQTVSDVGGSVRRSECGVGGVAEQEQHPGDADLRPDLDVDVADPNRTDPDLVDPSVWRKPPPAGAGALDLQQPSGPDQRGVVVVELDHTGGVALAQHDPLDGPSGHRLAPGALACSVIVERSAASPNLAWT